MITETSVPEYSLPTSSVPLAGMISCVENAKSDEKRGVVLLVDDEAVTLSILSRELQTLGFEIVQAANGREALRILAQDKIDLVLMDISMPVMDGYATLRLMRQMFSTAKLPIIMMTSSTDGGQVAACFNDGASDYLRKPVDFSVMRARVDAQLTLHRTQQALLESEQRYALASEGTRDGIWDLNLVTGEIYLSPRWLTMVGADQDSWQGKGMSWLELVYHEDRDRVRCDLEAHLCGESEHFETELRMTDQDGGFRWMLCRGLAVRDENSMPTRIAGSLTDITEGKVADALTRLPNRTLFHDRVARCVEQYKRDAARKFAILYLDVNDFKLINDSLGHDVGDKYLIALSHRLELDLRKCDAVLARLGGDEFGVLLENVDSVDDAVRVAERIQEKARIPLTVADREFLASISIGVVAVSPENCSVGELIRRADTAMYHAKQFTEGNISVFDERMLRESSKRLELSAELKHAIRRDELSVHYQPIINARTTVTAGFEALVRWIILSMAASHQSNSFHWLKQTG